MCKKDNDVCPYQYAEDDKEIFLNRRKSENEVAYFPQIGYSIIARYYMLYVVTQQEEWYGKIIS